MQLNHLIQIIQQESFLLLCSVDTAKIVYFIHFMSWEYIIKTFGVHQTFKQLRTATTWCRNMNAEETSFNCFVENNSTKCTKYCSNIAQLLPLSDLLFMLVTWLIRLSMFIQYFFIYSVFLSIWTIFWAQFSCDMCRITRMAHLPCSKVAS